MNRQVERFNRTLKEATVQRYHYKYIMHLNEHLQAFILAYTYQATQALAWTDPARVYVRPMAGKSYCLH